VSERVELMCQGVQPLTRCCERRAPLLQVWRCWHVSCRIAFFFFSELPSPYLRMGEGEGIERQRNWICFDSILQQQQHELR
jgi:hypothetical protein